MWKVICATLVIFVTGVVTGGLLVIYANHVSQKGRSKLPREIVRQPSNPPNPNVTVNPREANRLPNPVNSANRPRLGINLEFLQRLDAEVHLTAGQHERIERGHGHAREHHAPRRVVRDAGMARGDRVEVRPEVGRAPARGDEPGRDREPHRGLEVTEVRQLEHGVETIDGRPPEREGALDRGRVHRRDHPPQPRRQPIDAPLVDELEPPVLLGGRGPRQLVDEQQRILVRAPRARHDLDPARVERGRAHEAAHVVEARERRIEHARGPGREAFADRSHERRLGLTRQPDQQHAPIGREPRQDEQGQRLREVDAERE